MTTNRIVVGAHYGLRDWLAQRISAVVLLIYTLLLLGAVLSIVIITIRCGCSQAVIDRFPRKRVRPAAPSVQSGQTAGPTGSKSADKARPLP